MNVVQRMSSFKGHQLQASFIGDDGKCYGGTYNGLDDTSLSARTLDAYLLHTISIRKKKCLCPINFLLVFFLEHFYPNRTTGAW